MHEHYILYDAREGVNVALTAWFLRHFGYAEYNCLIRRDKNVMFDSIEYGNFIWVDVNY